MIVFGIIFWLLGSVVAFDYIVNNRNKGEVIDYPMVNVCCSLSWIGIAMILTYDMIQRWVK